MTLKGIDTVSSISEKDFLRLYFKPQKPVIIKNLASQYAAGSKWSSDYLKENCGDVNVDLFDNSIKNHTSSAFTTPDLSMRFDEYFDIILKNEPSPLRMFLFNMFRRKPSLRNDFPCPSFFRGILGRIGYMFFGAKNVTVRIHQDIDMSSVLLTQFHGRKKVVLVSPEYSDLLYRLPFNTYSLINPEKPDPERYPGLAFVVMQECILEPGDALFIPSGYWHYITYLDGGFAVSYRKLSPSLGTMIQGLVNLAVYMPFDKLMNRLLGDKWLARKERMAEIRANKAMAKIMFDGFPRVEKIY
jgi:ribosomal protein L16 Arg81 hydroxylase